MYVCMYLCMNIRTSIMGKLGLYVCMFMHYALAFPCVYSVLYVYVCMVCPLQYAVDFSVGQWVSDLYSELERSGRLRQGEEDRPAANAAQLQEDAQQKKEFLRTLLHKSSKSRCALWGRVYVCTYMLLCHNARPCMYICTCVCACLYTFSCFDLCSTLLQKT